MTRLVWCCLLLGVWGCADWKEAEALLPHPPVQRIEATVDSSGERRLIVLHPDKNEQLAVAVLSRSSVVATLKRRFPKDTTLRQLQWLRRENTSWLVFQAIDAKGRVDLYWNLEQNEFYSRPVSLTGGKRAWAKSPPKGSSALKLMETREAEEEREARERLRSCILNGAPLEAAERKRLDYDGSLSGAEWLQVEGQTVGVGVFSAEPTRVVLCREVSGSLRLEGLLPIEGDCMNFGHAQQLWFADIAPPDGQELLAEVFSTDCTGTHGGKTMLAGFSSPLDAAGTRQILFETREDSISGVDGYVEEETDFKFAGKAGDYAISATTLRKTNDTPTGSRRRRAYVWSKSQEKFVKK